MNYYNDDSVSIKDTLLKLPDIEKHERRIARRNYIFYKGKCILPLDKVGEDKDLLGQNWRTSDNCDYKPTQEIRNKVKPLLKKQARWMFGIEPTIKFKADNKEDKDKCEELRKFIEDILDDNNFWTITKQAFLEATIKKRALLRVEANPKSPLVIKYESIEDFYYKEKNGKLLYVTFFEEDEENVYREADTEKIYYLHTYYYKFTENNECQAWYKKEIYFNTEKQDDLTKEVNTGFSTIPCWLIKNGGELNDTFGESDVEELMDTQNEYNKTISDFRDALKFQMFGAESVIDGDKDDVKNFTIAPGALHAVKTRDGLPDGKQAQVQRLEYSMGNSTAVETYLVRAESDMNFTMDMPQLKDLNNIPSAKAMGYLYNDLMGRCDEKWNDWTPAFIGLFNFIKEVALICYPVTYSKEWNQLKYSTVFEHNYPLPSDEEGKKNLAMSEVEVGVRSHRSYIKDCTDSENAEDEWNEILQEKAQLTNAQDSFTQDLNQELNNANTDITNNGE
ncbi:phage portal protein [uncultured Clostridium sp.]|uniref:phage portal protein n=1 Tax=uncultured Clostridium sp. TaxID=59620 RepID=UPI0028F0AFCB|nr:phage portal protein [uncultured Clostridium sp.]